MTNLMSTIYIGYVVEIIKQNNKPTLDLRVRVPSIHGVSESTGIADIDLPIAKPLMMPGTQLDSNNFISFIENLNKVYIIFESGNYNNPVYLGLKTNSDIYDIPMDSVTSDWLDSFNIVNPQQDDILVYNTTTNKFENKLQGMVLPEFHYTGSTRPEQDIKIWIQINDDEIEAEPEMQMLFSTFGIPVIDDTQEDLEVTMFKSSEITNNEPKPFKIKLKEGNVETKDSQENIEQNNVNNKTKIKLNNNESTSLDNTINNTTNNTVVTKVKLGKTQRDQFNKKGQLIKHSNTKFRFSTAKKTNKINKVSNTKFKFNTVNKTNKINKVSKKIKLNERKV